MRKEFLASNKIKKGYLRIFPKAVEVGKDETRGK